MNTSLQKTLLVLAFSALSLSAIAAGGEAVKERAACVTEDVVQAVVEHAELFA